MPTSEVKQIICGDCRLILPGFPPDTFDSIVTDPPYGLSFMGKEWDHGVPGVLYWQEVLRVAKPGAHLLAFGGTRTFHRLAVAIEDAGWEIRDTVMWVYGSGFPKSLDVSKAIDKEAGAERKIVGEHKTHDIRANGLMDRKGSLTVAETVAAIQWQGYGTALKPAWEPIIVARKPIVGTVAQNVQKYGTGGINIDGCRVEVDPDVDDMLRVVDRTKRESETWDKGSGFKNESNHLTGVPAKGRFPANIIHDGSEEVLAGFPNTGNRIDTRTHCESGESAIWGNQNKVVSMRPQDNGGSAARFFYCAKASKEDRGKDNKHPTVKPTALMRYLCRLVTPPGGLILDPFAGSFSTGKAAQLEGFRFCGITLDEEDCRIGELRTRQEGLFT